VWYKLQLAKDFKDEERLFFPHNLDFRGRAYPLSALLQHTGDDLSRGLLKFAGPGPELGSDGLYWLKMHMANLLGADKLSMDRRIDYVNDRMVKVINVAEAPLREDHLEWWTSMEDPFQFIATAFELKNVLRNGERNAHNVNSSLPVHQDGSCNGLQHYAALGRDDEGAVAVNLCPCEEPADVYTSVLSRVKAQMQLDADKGSDMARRLLKEITRKVVKQTVMTSVYGVTPYGAKEQVQRQLEAIRKNSDNGKAFKDAMYLSNHILSSLGDLFSHAKETMVWLSDAATNIAGSGQPVHWISPIGLPCVQPYHVSKCHRIQTTLQSITIRRSTEGDKVHKIRQRMAFPPNYIHSLDSSHMLMSAKRCTEENMMFASVHDSFWTTPATVTKMNSILREAFIDLHSRPLLEELLEHFRLTYPTVKFREVPELGTLDITQVRNSPYFFD